MLLMFHNMHSAGDKAGRIYHTHSKYTKDKSHILCIRTVLQYIPYYYMQQRIVADWQWILTNILYWSMITVR